MVNYIGREEVKWKIKYRELSIRWLLNKNRDLTKKTRKEYLHCSCYKLLLLLWLLLMNNRCK